MKKVLIVEDDKKILQALTIRLRNAGLEVVSAEDASMAMTTAVREGPDLAVLDISLPGGNGFMVAERLQENERTAGTPILFITASSKPELEEQANKLGAVAFVRKPYDAGELIDTIHAALGLPSVPQPSA